MQWKERLYQSYVSTKQGGQDAQTGFALAGPYLNQIITRHIPLKRSARILDLGCGAGGMLFWLKKHGYRNVAGVDASQEMVDLAHRSGVPEVALDQIGNTLSRLEDRCIDVCLVIDVLEHLEMQELFDTCDEIFRVLKPGGRLILHVPNAEGVFGSRIRYSDLTHEIAFSSVSVRQLLKAVGFVDIRCFEDRPVPHGVKSIVRRILWSIGTAGFRLLYAAETGSFGCILSQNLLAVASVPGEAASSDVRD